MTTTQAIIDQIEQDTDTLTSDQLEDYYKMLEANIIRLAGSQETK